MHVTSRLVFWHLGMIVAASVAACAPAAAPPAAQPAATLSPAAPPTTPVVSPVASLQSEPPALSPLAPTHAPLPPATATLTSPAPEPAPASTQTLVLAPEQPIEAPAATETPAATGSASAIPEESPDVSTQTSPLVAAAVDDLARRLGVDAAAITVLSYEAVVWPDGGLGCPQPGMAYIQVQQDGARILLQANGVTYAYHSGGGRPPFLCEKPQKVIPGSGGGFDQ